MSKDESEWNTKLEDAFQTVLGEHLKNARKDANYVCYYEPYVDAESVDEMLSYCSSINTFAENGHYGVIQEDLVDELDEFEAPEKVAQITTTFAQSSFTFDSAIALDKIVEIFGSLSIWAVSPFILKGATDGTLNDALRWCMMLPKTHDLDALKTRSLEPIEARFQSSIAGISDSRLQDHLTNYFESHGRCEAKVVTSGMGTPGDLGLIEEQLGLEFIVGWTNNEYGLAHGVFATR